jgi:hypothetical protein
MSKLTLPEAAHILGMLPWQAELVLGETDYDLDAVEQVAQVRYRPVAHRHDRFSYWVSTAQAAEILGVSTARVKQLCVAEEIPYLAHRTGTRLMRRHHVQAIADARKQRRLGREG